MIWKKLSFAENSKNAEKRPLKKRSQTPFPLSPQTSKIKNLTIAAKFFNFDVCGGPGYANALELELSSLGPTS